MLDESDLLLKRCNSADADFLALVQELDQELSGRYGEEQAFFDVHNRLKDNTRVVLFYHQNQVIGCGSFRPMDKPFTVEIKRMYVRPLYRNHGVAKKILQALEAWAREESFTDALLETGVKQPEAIAAYIKAGYSVIKNYEPYVNSSYSVCMWKNLKQ